jgi:hypothetical protein
MPKKQKNKPGPKPTGRIRPFIIPFLVNADEDEYITRMAFKGSVSKTGLIRSYLVPSDMIERLIQLRGEQEKETRKFRRV